MRLKVPFSLTKPAVSFIILNVMAKNADKIRLRKLEIDEKTSELTIVGLEEDYSAQENPEREYPQTVPERKQSSVGKQLIMSNILGIKKLDKSVDKRQRVFKRVVSIVFIVFVVGVLGFTFYKDFFASPHEPLSWKDLVSTFSNTWFYLLLALLSLALAIIFKGVKLSVICKSQTGKWHLKTCLETGIIGHYYNNVTPLAVGGQPFEIYHLSKHGIHGGVAASMPIIAFFFSQFAFVSMGIVALVFFNGNVLDVPPEFITKFPAVFNVLAIIGLIGSISMPALVMIFSMLPRIGATLVKLFTRICGKLKIIKNPQKTEYKTLKTVVHNSVCIKRFAKKPAALIITLALAMGENLAQCSIAYFTLRLFGYDNPQAGGLLEWTQIVQLALILYASISFIPTPGNSGAADLSFYLLFTVGVPFAGLSFSAMILWRIISFYSYVIIGFAFTTFTRKKDRLAKFLGIDGLDE